MQVVRGGPGFALSMLMQKIDPVIRDMADIGKWQVRSSLTNLNSAFRDGGAQHRTHAV